MTRYEPHDFIMLPVPADMFTAVCALLGGATVTAAPRPTDAAPSAAAESPAPSAAAEASPPAGDDAPEIDAHGHPWNGDTYASTKTMTQDGLWRLKPGQSRPDPLPGYPKDAAASPTPPATAETPTPTPSTSPASPDADGATEQGGGSPTPEPSSAPASQDGAPASEAGEDDEFAAFRQAAAESDAAAASAGDGAVREWSDADLSSLLNQAALKLGGPEKIKEVMAEFVPEGTVVHSRHVPVERREEFAQRIEKLADIEFAG